MKDKIDCLFIGPNEITPSKNGKFLNVISSKDSAIHRGDINLNNIIINDEIYSAPELVKKYYFNYTDENKMKGSFSQNETFSPTIAYLANYISKNNLTYDYINSFQYEKDKLKEILVNKEIQLIAITTTFYVTFFPIKEIISFIKKYDQETKIVIGGPFILAMSYWNNPEQLKHIYKTIGADYYICNSQGEEALTQLIHSVKADSSHKKIKNLAYLENGKFTINSFERENNILEDNIVNWSKFSDDINNTVHLRTSISCPYKCSFCEYPARAGKYQSISLKRLEQEFDEIKKANNSVNISIFDDTFNVPVKRFKSILRMMKNNKYNFNWMSYFRCQYADEETVKLMKETGCKLVILGIESASPRILKNMNKNALREEYEKGLSLLNKYNIISVASFIIGFPGETHETLNETYEFIENSKPTFFRLSPWYCSPFTPIWEQRENFKLENSGYNWSHETMDINTALDLLEDIYKKTQNSDYIPMTSDDLFFLINKGISLEKLTNFIKSFNCAIKEKFIHPEQKNITPDDFNKIKLSLGNNAASEGI